MACNDMGLPRWSCVESPCARCPCSAADMFRLQPAVAWKRRCYTRHTFKPPPSPFWQGPGVSLRTHCLDPAHMLDKGISMHMLGSLFKDLVWDKNLQVVAAWRPTRRSCGTSHRTSTSAQDRRIGSASCNSRIL